MKCLLKPLLGVLSPKISFLARQWEEPFNLAPYRSVTNLEGCANGKVSRRLCGLLVIHLPL